MGIFRGVGGTGDSTDDGVVDAVTEQAVIATNKATEAATSATNAYNSAQSASTSKDTAITQANAAQSSANTASTHASNASTSATSAASSATSATASATTATTKASEASTSATNAATSETNAATSASTATTKASEAATSATTATTKAGEASTSATNAAASATSASTSASTATTKASEASTSAASAASSYDDFDDRYLGAKSSAPSTDNDGDALVTGALYFDTSSNAMKVYSGSAWLDAYASLSGALIATNNLSDLNNVSTARTNLGLGTAATTASTDYATAAQGTTADNALPKSGGAMTGAITTNSTFDGRDVSADGTKLDGIEAGATADQTASEIKTAYESNADTNAFTDADHTKLDGIEASADVTDTANVTAAGALMDSELTSEASVKALNQGVATTDSPSFVKLTAKHDTADQLQIGDTTDTNFWTLRAGTNLLFKDNGTERMRIDSSGVVTIGGNTVWHGGNDGSGSGLDADTVDGVQASSFLRSDAVDTATGNMTFDGVVNLNNTVNFNPNGYQIVMDTDQTRKLFDFYRNGSLRMSLRHQTNQDDFNFDFTSGSNLKINDNRILTTADEGSGSGLDADTVDGIQASSFLRSDTADATNSTLTFNTAWNEPMIQHGSSGPFVRSDGNYIYWDGGGTSGLYYIYGFGGVVIDSKTTITDDDGLVVRSSTNAVGAPIEFSDHSSGSYAQKGTLTYYHADSLSYGSGNAFVFEGSEASTSVVGHKAVFENYWVKPSSGTGAGTLLVDSSRNITANYVKADRLYANDDGSTGYFFNDSGTRVAYTGGDFYIQSGVGNCYIYATNTYLGNTSGDTIRFRGNTVTHNGWTVDSNGHFRMNDNKYFRLGSGSDVEHFWSGSHYYTDVNGGAWWYIRDGNSSNTHEFGFDIDTGNFHADGNIYAYSTSINSDIKLKDNVKEIENPLDKIDAIRGVTWNWKRDGSEGAGVIAQEVEQVMPSAVTDAVDMNSDETQKAVDYNQIIGLLVQSVKELKAEVEELKGAK